MESTAAQDSQREEEVPVDGPPTEEPINIFSAIDELQLELQLTRPIENLANLFQKTAIGIAIVTYYKGHHQLKESYRSFLDDLIIEEEIRSSPILTYLS